MAASTASKQADGAHRGFFCGHHAALPPHFCASPAHALRETSHAGCSCGPTMTSHACARAWAAPARAWASADWDCPPPEECHAQDTSRGRSLHAPWQNPCLRLHDRAPLDWTDERPGRFGPEGLKTRCGESGFVLPRRAQTHSPLVLVHVQCTVIFPNGCMMIFTSIRVFGSL